MGLFEVPEMLFVGLIRKSAPLLLMNRNDKSYEKTHKEFLSHNHREHRDIDGQILLRDIIAAAGSPSRNG
jgi:hypothetical protein